MEEYKTLKKINQVSDLKQLSISELEELSNEVRDFILNKVSEVGGHLGPNLGIIETTIALHYVFNSPIDKIVWDVSHQCYPHKILTGRKGGFENFKVTKEISGFTNKYESEHDFFNVGHTSTSISLACGLAVARNINGNHENIIAVIGDGSLSGGEAFEGLNNAGTLNSNFIIVVNDNEMSIGENYGSLYDNLKLLRETKGLAENNFFKTLGFEYTYVENGNNVSELIDTFKKIKDTNKPIVVHVHTKKGKGYSFAEENPEMYHYTSPFNVETGKPKRTNSNPTYTSIIAEHIYEKSKNDDKIVVLNAATSGAVGLVKFREDFPSKYFDVGIAEEHLIAFASGLASQKIKPITVFMSSFIQRSYDQIAQDLCLNNNPALIIVEGAGISGTDMTHVGMYDIAMLSNIPNFVYLAPTSDVETKNMINWALTQDFPIGIRVSGEVINNPKHISSSNIELNKFERVISGEKIAVIGLGNFFKLAEEIVDKLKEEKHINATLINPRFITGLDEDLLNELLKNHDTIVTLEDGILEGGFGEKIASFYGSKNVKVYNFGAKKEIIDRVSYKELLKRYNLDANYIVTKILDINEKAAI